MPTIVDSLIVTLGLDPSDFTRNEKKAAADLIKGQRAVQRSVKETSSSVDKAAKETGKAITSMARQFAIAFLGFSGAAGFTKFLAQLNGMARNTKMVATNLGTSATELKRFQNVAELSGSNKDAAASFLNQIQEQQYQQKTTGLPGWVKELRSMKYDLYDSATGKFKDEMQVALDLADKFKELEKSQGRDTAVQRFAGMGVDPSIINMLGRGRGWIEQQLKRQKDRYGDNENAFNRADKVAQTFTDIKQRLEDFGIKLLAKLQPFIDKLASQFDKWIGSVDMNKLADSIIELTTQLAQLLPILARLAGGAAGAFQDVGTWLGEKAGAIAEAVDQFGENGIVNQGKDADPVVGKLYDSVTGSMFGRRNRTTAQIVDSLGLQNDERAQARYLNMVQRATGVTDVDKVLSFDEQQKVEDLARSLAKQAASKARVVPKAAATTGALMQTPNALQFAQGAGASAAVASNGGGSRSMSSSVTIGELNINGASGNGRQIAGDMVAELQRRKLVAQADYGMA